MTMVVHSEELPQSLMCADAPLLQLAAQADIVVDARLQFFPKEPARTSNAAATTLVNVTGAFIKKLPKRQLLHDC